MIIYNHFFSKVVNKTMDAFGNPWCMAMTFELHDFIDDQNFDQFIDLIQDETKTPFLV